MRVKKFAPLTLLLRDVDIFYVLLLIERGDDESIYVKFPRHRGYRVKDSHESIDIPSRIVFREHPQDRLFFNPYLSYHPLSGKTHVNAYTAPGESSNNKKVVFFSDTSSTKGRTLLETHQFAPLASVVLPLHLPTYDCIGKRPAPFRFNYLEISDQPLFPRQEDLRAPSVLAVDKMKVAAQGHLNVEVFLHRKDLHTIRPNLRDIHRRSIVEVVKLDSTLANLSFSLVLSALPTPADEQPSPDIVVFLFNHDKVIGFALD